MIQEGEGHCQFSEGGIGYEMTMFSGFSGEQELRPLCGEKSTIDGNAVIAKGLGFKGFRKRPIAHHSLTPALLWALSPFVNREPLKQKDAHDPDLIYPGVV